MKKILLFTIIVLIYNTNLKAQCSTYGGQLVTNGGFEMCGGSACTGTIASPATYTDYSPSYSPVSCGTGMNAIGGGRFAITSDANACFNGWHNSGTGDQATVHSGSYAMLIDGNGVSDIWCQTVTVSPGTRYEFFAWYQNAVRSGVSPGAIPSLQLTINGAAITSSLAEVTYLSGWEQNKCYWQAPAGITSAAICVELVATSSTSGNDILLDDISFRAASGGSCPAAGTCTYTGTTPIELSVFKAERAGESAVTIKWTSLSEKNSYYYAIEKSTNGKDFYEIGIVNAMGHSNNVVNYDYTDEHFETTAFYRLKMFDRDGTFKTTYAIKISKNGDYVSSVKYNGETLEITANVENDVQWNINLVNLLGQELVKEKLDLTKGENIIIKNTQQLQSGSKIVRITDNNGNIILSGALHN